MNNSKDESIIRALRQSGKTDMVMDEMASQHALKPLAIHGNNVTVRDVFGRIHTIPGVSSAEIKRLKAQGVPETFANRAARRAAARRAIQGRHREGTAPQAKGEFQEYNLSGAQTGRLDSSKPNLSNPPKPALRGLNAHHVYIDDAYEFPLRFEGVEPESRFVNALQAMERLSERRRARERTPAQLACQAEVNALMCSNIHPDDAEQAIQEIIKKHGPGAGDGLMLLPASLQDEIAKMPTK